jgi:hypothetical protein
METKDKLDLETLKSIAFSMGLFSDMTTKTQGYRWLTELINKMECEGKKETTELSSCNKPAVSKCEDVEREALLKLKQFVANQKDLPDDINQIVNDNFWELF